MGDTIVPITRSMAGTMLDHTSPNHGISNRVSPNHISSNHLPHNYPASNGVGRGKTLEEYDHENRQLKIAVDQLSRKVASYKEVLSPLHPYSLLLTPYTPLLVTV
jgi:hypothetical protein